MMKVLISGSHGMVGGALTMDLRRTGAQVSALSRDRTDQPNKIFWEPLTGKIDSARLQEQGDVDVVVHLAGENLANRRWTGEQKRKIYESRVPATQKLCVSLAQLPKPPSLFICASAVGYYGNRGDELIVERSEPGSGFLAGTCADWESAAEALARVGTRVVHLRFGMILSAEGGALKRMLPIFKLGLGGPLGSGKQWMSWISLADVIRVIRFMIESDRAAGAYNTVAPQPVRNAEFAKILAEALHRPAFFKAPAFALRLMFGEMADEALLASARVVPERLIAEGFSFHEADLRTALARELSVNHPSST